MNHENRGGGFFAGFLLGAVIGGIAAILLTQEDTRDIVLGKVREAGNFAVDATGDLRDLYDAGRQVVDSARNNVDAAIREGSAQADALRQELRHKTEA
jgi:gas vesicle protein